MSLTQRRFEATSLIPLGFVLFLAAMTLGGFAQETRLTFRELVRTVDGWHTELR